MKTTNFSKIAFTGLVCVSISLFFLYGTSTFAQLYTPDRVPKLIGDLPVFFKPLEIQLLSDTSDGLLNAFTLKDTKGHQERQKIKDKGLGTGG